MSAEQKPMNWHSVRLLPRKHGSAGFRGKRLWREQLHSLQYLKADKQPAHTQFVKKCLSAFNHDMAEAETVFQNGWKPRAEKAFYFGSFHAKTKRKVDNLIIWTRTGAGCFLTVSFRSSQNILSRIQKLSMLLIERSSWQPNPPEARKINNLSKKDKTQLWLGPGTMSLATIAQHR